MQRHQLGEFEEIVMLTVGVLYDQAYGIAIKQEITARLERKVSVGALQVALRRLEEKGYLSSRRGESNPKRGGRPKLFFTITALGAEVLQHKRDTRNQLWNSIPPGALQLNRV